MTFGRWLLVHSFSIFLVSLVILGYIYREPLQLEQAYQQLLQQPIKLQRNLSPETKRNQPQSTPDVVVKPAVEIATPEQKINQRGSSAEDKTVEDLESSPTVSSTIIEIDELLLKARKAYWEKDYPMAIQYYQQLINDDERNPDLIGELGNIYYSLNDYENAAIHFYQAATILISQGKREQARTLVSPISAMNRGLGDQLKRQIREP